MIFEFPVKYRQRRSFYSSLLIVFIHYEEVYVQSTIRTVYTMETLKINPDTTEIIFLETRNIFLSHETEKSWLETVFRVGCGMFSVD